MKPPENEKQGFSFYVDDTLYLVSGTDPPKALQVFWFHLISLTSLGVTRLPLLFFLFPTEISEIIHQFNTQVSGVE